MQERQIDTDNEEITIPLSGSESTFRVEFTPRENELVKVSEVSGTACLKPKGTLTFINNTLYVFKEI